MKALRDALTSRYAVWAVILLAGLAACQGVEFGVGVKPAAPPPDPAVVKQVEDAKIAVGEAERKAKEAGQLAAEAEAARATAVATATDLERKVAAGEATQADLEQARRRATEAAAEATQAKERADRARAWTDDFTTRVTAANDRLSKAEAAWRDAAGGGLNVEGPKDTTPWGLLSWAISTGLLVVLNEKRKREAKAVLDAAKQESADVVARQDDALPVTVPGTNGAPGGGHGSGPRRSQLRTWARPPSAPHWEVEISTETCTVSWHAAGRRGAGTLKARVSTCSPMESTTTTASMPRRPSATSRARRSGRFLWHPTQPRPALHDRER